jgi:hypothetical protein
MQGSKLVSVAYITTGKHLTFDFNKIKSSDNRRSNSVVDYVSAVSKNSLEFNDALLHLGNNRTRNG